MINLQHETSRKELHKTHTSNTYECYSISTSPTTLLQKYTHLDEGNASIGQIIVKSSSHNERFTIDVEYIA